MERLYISQVLLDKLFDLDDVQLNADELLHMPSGLQMHLEPAVYITGLVTEEGSIEEIQEAKTLVGCVWDAVKIREQGGEHYGDSMLLGMHAYSVTEGFVGVFMNMSEGSALNHLDSLAGLIDRLNM